MRALSLSGCVTVALASTAMALATGQLLAQKGTSGAEWRSYAGDAGATKYSPLTQIDAANFSTLRVVWRWQSADRYLSRTIPGRGEVWAPFRTIFDQLSQADPKRWRDGQPPIINNFKATPLMVGGRLFLNTPISIGAAVDGKTGQTLWIYNPKSYEAGTTTMTARWNQRGVAHWTDGTDERIFWGTGDRKSTRLNSSH